MKPAAETSAAGDHASGSIQQESSRRGRQEGFFLTSTRNGGAPDNHIVSDSIPSLSHSAFLSAMRPVVRLVARGCLTVVCYHRVIRRGDKRFQGYKPTINASQEAFSEQIEYLRANYDPISLSDLAAWIDGRRGLPPQPALVTFDDGYRDNAEVAWPIMRERGVPAVIFLATDYIGTGRPFIWDLAAYLFATTTLTSANVPLVGLRSLATDAHRDAATATWVDAMKRLPGAKRSEAVASLAKALDIDVPGQEIFEHLYMDWDDVRRLAREGVEFGGHTCSHPILTGISEPQGSWEIEESIRRVTEATGFKTLGFAYPNGSSRDYSDTHEKAVLKSGVPLAFSLEPGPMRLHDVSKRRTGIRRIYVGAHESMPRFVAKLSGVARLAHALRG
ncbi:polysaccharide deacetylase family protein [Microvirga subterranea]|uniref:Chitooligosaccharide deacetylase n=1 Tax=Microvirga subterranea TaxID=186651 RepID=A0A370HQX4_9HYPH|nr:polysaccharide deacetylase family protein [Microvirga subterranea]RDI59314.1 polysaccharide deacetylase [Microvirga subterranea]